MSQKWYYVKSGDRKGPVEFDEVVKLYKTGDLTDDDYVWAKSYKDWTKIKNLEEFSQFDDSAKKNIPNIPPFISNLETIDLQSLEADKKNLYIKIGADRSGEEKEYGPFSLVMLKTLFEQNRVNAKTLFYTSGMNNWKLLGELKGFEEVFHQSPPVIEEVDNRVFKRKPFIARMFFQANHQLFEGICRDISVGGMQVLVDHFPAEVGEKIDINVHPENSDHHFVASAEVVRLIGGNQGFSLKFINLSEQAISAINAYITHQ